MTTVTINLSEQHAAALSRRAQAEGTTLEGLLEKVAAGEAETATHLQDANPEEWTRRLDTFLDSQDPATPVLPLEAMTRESIYP